MTSRTLGLELETLPASPAPCSGTGGAASPSEETSLIALLRQRLCSDEELADQLQSGNADALTVLFKRYSGRLFGIARRMLRDDAEAEDAVQLIFLDVFRSIHQFDVEKGSFRTWLFLFAYHRTFNRRRSQTAHRFFDTDPLDSADQLEGSSQRSHSRSCAADNAILIDQVLRTLQPRQRRTIQLVYDEGFTTEEIASRTGESVCVVRHNLYRGLDKLRKAFRAREQGAVSPKGDLS